MPCVWGCVDALPGTLGCMGTARPWSVVQACCTLMNRQTPSNVPTGDTTWLSFEQLVAAVWPAPPLGRGRACEPWGARVLQAGWALEPRPSYS